MLFRKSRNPIKNYFVDWINPNRVHFKKAIFLDRDGTINIDKNYTYKRKDLEFFKNTLAALKILSTLNYQIIIITNQAGIALKHYTESEMSSFNRSLVKKIHKAGGRIDSILFCPELEEKDIPKNTQKLHFCMKPNPGLLIQASRMFNINLKESIVIGDKLSDIKAGQAVGAFTILVNTGEGGTKTDSIVNPNQIKDDLLDAAIFIYEESLFCQTSH